jgi:SulP family sulfate permease
MINPKFSRSRITSGAVTKLKTHLLQEIRPGRLLPILAGGLVTGVLEVIEVTAYAVLIYSGELSGYIPRGLGILLMGSVVVVILTALFCSLPGLIAGLQDTVIAILALISAAIVSQMPFSATHQEKFVTVVVALALSSLMTGALFLSLGQFKLGNLIRFIPYPVIGGVLAGSGLLLTFGAISVMTGAPVSLLHLSPIMQPGLWVKLLPGFVFALFLLLVLRRHSHVLIFPGTLMAATIVFYLLLGMTNTSIATATQQGWLLSALPANGSRLWQPLNFSDLAQVNWSAVGHQTGSLFAIAIVGVLAILLNLTGIELATGQDVDLNRDLKAAGIANLVAGLGGSTVGWHTLSRSTMVYKMGVRSRLVAFVQAAVCGIVLWLGGSLLSYFPKPIITGLLLFIGLDFLVTWVYDSWFKLPITDYLIMILILIVINTIGFLEGVGLGLVLAVILFVVDYSRINVVKHTLTGATFHSNVTRPRLHQQLLRRKGDWLCILELQGFIFFGTTQRILDMVRQRIDNRDLPPLRFLVLDFRWVSGFDSSALFGFAKMKQLTETRGITLVFTHLSTKMQHQMKKEILREGEKESPRVFADLDHGIEWCEDHMVTSFESLDFGSTPSTLMIQLEEAMPSSVNAAQLMTYFEEKKAERGEYILRQGEDSALYFIEAGKVTVQLESDDGKVIRLRTMRSGTVVGELGLYLHRKASASVIADEPCTLFYLPAAKLKEMEEDAPEIASAFHKFLAGILSERLIDTNDALEALIHLL